MTKMNFLPKLHPNPSKPAVKTIYSHDYYTKLIEKHMQNIK